MHVLVQKKEGDAVAADGAAAVAAAAAAPPPSPDAGMYFFVDIVT